MENFSTPPNFAQIAYNSLLKYEAERLHLICLLIAEGQTPQNIHDRIKAANPDEVAFPVLCAAAAQFIIDQKADN